MVKHFCDRCGTECRNYYATLQVNETHLTGRGEELEEGYMRHSRHLCAACKASLQEWFGSDLGLLSEDAWAALQAQRGAERAEYAGEKAAYIAAREAHP